MSESTQDATPGARQFDDGQGAGGPSAAAATGVSAVFGEGPIARDLVGRVAIVTGASRGIGKGCALELGLRGATVYVTGRSVSESDHPLPGTVGRTAAEVDEIGGHGVAVGLDHRDDAAVEALFQRVADEHGRLDVLVNAAFLIPPELTSRLPFWEVPISNWDEMIDVGTRSAYVASVFAARMMVPAGSGLIANISSSGAQEYAWHVAYGVGKCALDRLTADTAHELAPHGVSVVSVWPGFVRTERIDIAVATGRLPASLDISGAESPQFTGRAVATLAADPGVARWTGRAVSANELAIDYGFRDLDGRLPAGPLRHR